MAGLKWAELILMPSKFHTQRQSDTANGSLPLTDTVYTRNRVPKSSKRSANKALATADFGIFIRL